MKTFVSSILLCVCILSSAVADDSAPKLALTIIGHTNDVAGLPAVVFQITNRSSSSVTFTFETQVRKNETLKWYPADLHHPVMITHVLAAQSSQELVIHSPQG